MGWKRPLGSFGPTVGPSPPRPPTNRVPQPGPMHRPHRSGDVCPSRDVGFANQNAMRRRGWEGKGMCVCGGVGKLFARSSEALPDSRWEGERLPPVIQQGLFIPGLAMFALEPLQLLTQASKTRHENTERPRAAAAQRSAALRAALTAAAPSRSAARSVQRAGSPGAPRPARPWPAGSPRCQESASPAASLPHRIVYQKMRASRKQKRRQITLSTNNPVCKPPYR